MKELGEKLRQARIEKGLSLEDIAESTKIAASKLRAIEDANLKALPKRSYLRGFFRTYARCLDLNESEILHEFDSNMHRLQKEKEEEEASSKLSIENHKPKVQIKYLLIFLAFLLLLLSVYFYKIMNDYEKESIVPNYKDNQNFDKIEIEDEPASNEKTEFKNKPETSNQKTPKANENSEVTASENNTTKQKTTINEDKVNENSQKNKIESKNSEQQKKETLETTIQTPSTTNTEAQAKREELSPPLLTEKVHLVIDALETIKVLSITDGKTVTRILEPGETLVLEAKKSLEVSIDKGGLANITLNNNDKGILGTLGEPLKLKFP